MTSLIAWIIAAVAGVAVLAFYLRVRALALELGQSTVENEKLRGELNSSRSQLEHAQAKLRRTSDDLAELRKRLEKTKKRAARGQDSGRSQTASPLQALDDELEQTRQARDSAREEAAGLSSELSRLRTELAKAQSAAQAHAEREAERPMLDIAAIETLRKRCEQAEAALADARPEIDALHKASARMKGRLDTQEKLYVSIRSELEAKKDRLRTQHEEIERLQALKVAFVDPLPEESAKEADSAGANGGAVVPEPVASETPRASD